MVQHNAKPGFTGSDAKQENDPGGGQNGTTLLRIGRMDTFPIWSLGPAQQMGKSYTPAVQEPLRERQ